jgi:hypothetical protein
MTNYQRMRLSGREYSNLVAAPHAMKSVLDVVVQELKNIRFPLTEKSVHPNCAC